jgi:hypothetical protein
MDPQIDLIADLNAEDDEGLGWSTLADARDPARIRPGVMRVAGNRHAPWRPSSPLPPVRSTRPSTHRMPLSPPGNPRP